MLLLTLTTILANCVYVELKQVKPTLKSILGCVFITIQKLMQHMDFNINKNETLNLGSPSDTFFPPNYSSVLSEQKRSDTLLKNPNLNFGLTSMEVK